MYRYETHLHTLPVSRCAKVGMRETLEFYKKLDYAGVFITNHFIDGNLNMDKARPYEEKIEFFFSGSDEGRKIGGEIGLPVFEGLETSLQGTDFLVYGLFKDWFLAHPEITEMSKRQQLEFYMDCGALVVQAHPFREARYIDHFQLFPRSVHGIETINACRTDFENRMADIYAEEYGLLKFAGSDNHFAAHQPKLSGMDFDTPVKDELDFVRRILGGEGQLFFVDNPLYED